MGYQEGADLGLDFKYPYQHFNRIKNHWRQSDPVTALFDAQPGMIASDSDDEKLYHFTGQSPGFDEILQENYSFDKIPRFLGVDLWSNAYHHIIRASEAEGLAGADLRIGLDETLRSLIICDRGDIAADFGLAAQVHPTLYLKSANGADHLFMYHDGTDAYFKTDDGAFVFQTDEGTDTATYLDIKGKGTGVSVLRLFDEDDAEQLYFHCASGTGVIQTQGVSPGVLSLQSYTPQHISCWASISSGNPSLILHGWNTAGGDLQSTALTMDDTNDEFLIQAANSANHEGVTVSLPEANQKFRIRGVASALRFYVKSDGEIGTNQTAAATTLGNVTDRLPIYDESQNLVGYIPIYDSIT